MHRSTRGLWLFGLIAAAAGALASQEEASIPTGTSTTDAAAVPAAEHVETVLRATYVLPPGRVESLAAFLRENAAPGIDVRFENDRLIVIAPAEAQRSLGQFIATCVSKEKGLMSPSGGPYERLTPIPAASSAYPVIGPTPPAATEGFYFELPTGDAPTTPESRSPMPSSGQIEPVRRRGARG